MALSSPVSSPSAVPFYLLLPVPWDPASCFPTWVSYCCLNHCRSQDWFLISFVSLSFFTLSFHFASVLWLPSSVLSTILLKVLFFLPPVCTVFMTLVARVNESLLTDTGPQQAAVIQTYAVRVGPIWFYHYLSPPEFCVLKRILRQRTTGSNQKKGI